MAGFGDFCAYRGQNLLRRGKHCVLPAPQAGRSIASMTGTNPAGFAPLFANRMANGAPEASAKAGAT
jgi:hypothetical protein